jgi:fermentation-respiration switch protein FrsA (DUF1100 family)
MYPPKLRCSKEHFVFCGTPSEQNLIFEDFKISVSDGVELSGWWIPSPNSRGVIIMSHGHGGDRREGMRYARALHTAGFSIITFDYRSSDPSQNYYDTMDYFERSDLMKIIDFAATKGTQKIGLLGFSQGSATGIITMALDPRVEVGLFEGSYANAADVIAFGASSQFRIPRFPLVDLALWFFEQRTSADLTAMNPSSYIGKIAPRPVMIFHATKDPIVPFEHAEELVKSAPGIKTWFFQDIHHVRGWQFDTQLAENLVVNFFSSSMPKDEM